MGLAPWAIVLLGLLLAAFAGLVALRGLGRWLVAVDPLAPAAAIAILGGRLPYRAMEAAALYHQGWAPRIWVTRYPLDPESAKLLELGVETTPEYVFNRRILLKLGVPEEAIVTLEKPCVDTREELEILRDCLDQRHPGGAIILVTSKVRARRAKLIWKACAGGSHRAILRCPEQDAFAADRWFANTRDLSDVAYESFGLLNVRFGYPLKKRV